MMREILEMISRGGFSYERVARELDITKSTLADRMEMLQRMGYVKDITDVCGSNFGSCGSCPSASECRERDHSASGNPRIFVLTDKGKAALQTMGPETK
ncbi:MAG: winged helix-turn-helix transcriptional regulator [Thermoplasmatota archaeon]